MLKRFLLISQSMMMELGNSEDIVKFLETSMLLEREMHTNC